MHAAKIEESTIKMPPEREPDEKKFIVMQVPDESGHNETSWDPNDTDEVAGAKSYFESMKKKGFAAFRVEEGGRRGEQMHDFEPRAGRIIFSKPMKGG